MSKVLVVGDSCTDVFVYGKVERLCPEAPVPVINPTHQTENGGMAKNVVSNLEALGCDVELVSNKNSIRKVRYVDERSNQMVLRIDENDSCREINSQELNFIKNNKFDVVIVSDYCKGFLKEKHIQYICEMHNNVFVDTKKQLGEWILEADYIKINEFEHKKNFERIPNYPSMVDKLIVTQGKKGCTFKDTMFPTEEVPVKDVSGAGDTLLDGLVYEYIKTKDIEKSIKFAQKCTTKVVQKHGVSTI